MYNTVFCYFYRIILLKFLIMGMQLEAVWLTMLIINIVDGVGLTFIHVSSILSNRKGEME